VGEARSFAPVFLTLMQSKERAFDRRFSVAPMMDWTDRHCRFFLRQLSPHAVLYTEMITAAALVHGNRAALLGFDSAEHPVALQLGGSDPHLLAQAAEYGAAEGYDEINLNVGCPSDRVQSGAFGACLMAKPRLVADCVAAMNARVSIPVTVKVRIGIEEGAGAVQRGVEYTLRDYERLHEFVTLVAAAGCDIFAIHARKAVLTGLSPKENREVPPLRYDIVRQLKRDLPRLTIVANGGVRSFEQVEALLADVDGVMIGREAYHNPYLLAQLEAGLFPSAGWSAPSRLEVLERFTAYAEGELRNGHTLAAMTRHILGLFSGSAGARSWRRYFSESSRQSGAGIEVLRRACEMLRRQEAA
jgi:tRNA-dihydrouridine synthase A